MSYRDLNLFLCTFLYPILDKELLYGDSFSSFLERSIAIQKERRKEKERPSIMQLEGKLKDREKFREQAREQVLSYIGLREQIPSYDMVYQYMERWYFGNKVQLEFLEEEKGQDTIYDMVLYHLKRLSISMISTLDHKIIYKYWENEKDKEILGGFSKESKIHLFRSLNQIIPMDLMVVLFALKNSHQEKMLDGFLGHIMITDALLEKVLRKGVAENHLHFGVSRTFLAIWDNWMEAPILSTIVGERYVSIYGIKKEEWVFQLHLARYIHRLLCLYMAMIRYKVDEVQVNKAHVLSLSPIQIVSEKTLRKIKDKLLFSDNPIEEIKKYFQKLDFEFESHFRCAVLDIENRFSNINTTKECIFYYYFFKTVDEYQKSEENFVKNMVLMMKKLFLVYLRLKNSIFQGVVQNKGIHGLDFFQQFYHNSSKLNDDVSSNDWYEKLFSSIFSISNLKKIEMRTSFPPNVQLGRKNIHEFLLKYQKILQEQYCIKENGKYRPYRPFPKVGLVYHFIKSEDTEHIECIENGTMQYYALYKKYLSLLREFKAVRNCEKFKGIDRYLVGIDVASLENVVPTWVFTKIFEEARDAKDELLFYRNQEYQSLKFTCHAGEDFRHLLSGIRRIEETIHYLKFHAGDRIGHGLALGQDPEKWVQNNQNVILPRIEAIENYVWAYKMLSTTPNSLGFSNFEFLKYRIYELSKEIYPIHSHKKLLTIEDWLEAYELLFQFPNIRADYQKEEKGCTFFDHEQKKVRHCEHCEHKWGEYDKIYGAKHIVESYHCVLYNDKMQEPIHYKIQQQELEIIIELQKIIRKKVAKAGIIVEANPNSNITIGDIQSLLDHPMYRISNQENEGENILLCVNSDDPCVFHTNVINELGFAYFGMIERGIGRESCVEWIDKIRQVGYQYSFIQESESDEMLLRELNELIKSL